jgi:hypothetical protein
LSQLVLGGVQATAENVGSGSLAIPPRLCPLSPVAFDPNVCGRLVQCDLNSSCVCCPLLALGSQISEGLFAMSFRCHPCGSLSRYVLAKRADMPFQGPEIGALEPLRWRIFL